VLQDLCAIDSTKALGSGSVGFVWTPLAAPVDSDDEEEEEEDEEVFHGGNALGHQHVVDPVRMGSIGCTDDERWKR